MGKGVFGKKSKAARKHTANRPKVSKKRLSTLERLTPMQRKFVNCLNEMEDPEDWIGAARNAGYANPSAAAVKLRSIPDIRKIIREDMEKRHKKSLITAEMIEQEIAYLAFLDPIELFKEKNGTIKLRSFDDLTPLQRKLIDRVEISTTTKRVKGKNIKTVNVSVGSITTEVKLKALTLLAKHKGMLIDKRQEEHVHKVNWEDYYKARQDDADRRAKEEVAERAKSMHALALEDHRESVPPTGEILEAEYSIAELVDGAPEA